MVAVALLTRGTVLLIRGGSTFGNTPSVSLLSSLLLLTGLLVRGAGHALRGSRRTG
ncbi:hypothetical protein ACFYPN_03735 [Streptomyces sp. NPDC005576]|uniref:hypothetical protein n=1 Tax=Streptomyces sp. NPDC005576 TaxID=3364726 RepID=UPI0036B347E3